MAQYQDSLQISDGNLFFLSIQLENYRSCKWLYWEDWVCEKNEDLPPELI